VTGGIIGNDTITFGNSASTLCPPPPAASSATT
jgi:hypothetical protein